MAILLVILAVVVICVAVSLIPTIIWFCIDHYWAEVTGVEWLNDLHFGYVWLTFVWLTFILISLLFKGSSYQSNND